MSEKKKTVKVRIMKAVGTYTPGQDVELDEEMAKQLCAPRIVSIGDGKKAHHIVAMTHDEIERLKQESITDKGGNGLTQHELRELGMKNVVETPKDSAFDSKLYSVKKEEKIEENEAHFSETKEDGEPKSLTKAQQKKAAQAAAKAASQSA